GDDTYLVHRNTDTVIEAAGEGTDTVRTDVDYTLTAGQEIEALSAASSTATTALHLTGNEFANTITGNAGDNWLNGGGGNDILYGLGGSDQFVFETALDALNNHVQIGDFTPGQDHIVLASSVFTGLGANHTLLDTSFLTIGSREIDSDDHVLY